MATVGIEKRFYSRDCLTIVNTPVTNTLGTLFPNQETQQILQRSKVHDMEVRMLHGESTALYS